MSVEFDPTNSERPRSALDLEGINVNLIDPYLLSVLLNPDIQFSYSGDTRGFIEAAYKAGAFAGEAPFLIRVYSQEVALRTLDLVSGLKIISYVGPIVLAVGDIHAVIALAKMRNVIKLEASKSASAPLLD
jgi:hypothetical protein